MLQVLLGFLVGVGIMFLIFSVLSFLAVVVESVKKK